MTSYIYVGDNPSPAGPDYPIPSGDQSSPQIPLPDDSIFDGPASDSEGTGWLDVLRKMILAVHSDPNGIAQEQILDAYIQKAMAHGKMAEMMPLIDGTDGSFDLAGFLDFFSQQEAILATIYGTPGDPSGPGLQSGLNWINNEITKVNSWPDSPLKQKTLAHLEAELDALPDWYKTHWDADKKEFVFTFQSPNVVDPTTGLPLTITYYLDPNNPNKRDNAMIYLMIATSGITGSPNTFWKSFDESKFNDNYALKMVDDMLKEGKDAFTIVMAMLMLFSDGTNADMMGTQASTTRTTNVVDNTQDALESLFNPGSMDEASAQKYAEALMDSLTTVSTDGTFSNQKGDYVSNSFIPEWNYKFADGNTVGSLIQKGDYKTLAADMNSMPSADISSFKSYISSGSNLFTQLSKQLGVETSTETADLGKYTNSMTDDMKTRNGLVDSQIKQMVVG